MRAVTKIPRATACIQDPMLETMAADHNRAKLRDFSGRSVRTDTFGEIAGAFHQSPRVRARFLSSGLCGERQRGQDGGSFPSPAKWHSLGSG